MIRLFAVVSAVACAAIALGQAGQADAKEALLKTVEAYAKANTFTSTTTTKLYVHIQDSKNDAELKTMQLEYRFNRAGRLWIKRSEFSQPGAKLPNIVEHVYWENGELWQNQGRWDGQQVHTSRKSVKTSPNPAVLLEFLPQFNVEPMPDMVFLLGGRTQTERFLGKITELRMTKQESGALLTGKTRDESNRPVDLEIVLGPDNLMQRMKMSVSIKYENHKALMVVDMEFKPVLNPELEDTDFAPAKVGRPGQ